MKRDIIKEITEKKRRSHIKAERFWNASKKFSLIVDSYENIVANNSSTIRRKELLKYIPIALVTLIENYFRQLIKDIILLDDKYLSNVNKLKNIKIDLETIIETQKNNLTIADLVSHLIPVKNLNDIVNNLSIILDIDYIKTLKEFIISHKKFHILNCGEILKSISTVFELRNIYVHEYAFKVPIKIKEVDNLLNDCFIFILLSDEMYIKYLKKA